MRQIDISFASFSIIFLALVEAAEIAFHLDSSRCCKKSSDPNTLIFKPLKGLYSFLICVVLARACIVTTTSFEAL